MLYAVKMRASLGGKHISGAERIVRPGEIAAVAAALEQRALSHPKGVPDDINIKVFRLETEPVRVPRLKVVQHETATPAEGWAVVREVLAGCGVSRIDEITGLFAETYSMRGAMLLSAATLERLEPDKARGVRATLMDDESNSGAGVAKNHFAEAIVLASKVLSAPGIVGEICVSDDPDYVTGYVSANGVYHRITVLKGRGSPQGGRIFLYSGDRATLKQTLDYLERTPVFVSPEPLKPPQAIPTPELFRRRCRVLPPGLVSFASNDYLALANDPRVKNAAAAAAMRWGAGSTGARLLTGTLPPHVELEKRIARFLGAPAALTFSTGYMANTGIIPAIAGKTGAIVSDELNHASIIDGCRLSGAKVFVYRHNDMSDLRRALTEAKGHLARTCFHNAAKSLCSSWTSCETGCADAPLLAVSDAVFSMDGDLLDLPQFLALSHEFGAIPMIDEAHAIGVVGRTGRGLCEHFCIEPPPELVRMGTLSKALGSEGAFACASRETIDLLVNKARSFIFTTSPAPAAVAAAAESLAILESDPERVEKLRSNVAFAVEEFARRGVKVATQSAILPIIVGNEAKSLEIARLLEEHGFYIPAIRYPTVAVGAARLRMSLTPAHTRDEITRAVELVTTALA